MSRFHVSSLLLACVLVVLALGEQLPAQERYLDFHTFRALQSLAPELVGARLCSLTQVAHELWERGQLRVPETGIVKGDYKGDGHEHWAILLAAGPNAERCTWVLIATRAGDRWRRLLLQQLEVDDRVVGIDLLWDETRRAIGIDLGERKRITAPATLRSQDGRVVEARPGYVIEARLISHFIRWDDQLNQFKYEIRLLPEEIVERPP